MTLNSLRTVCKNFCRCCNRAVCGEDPPVGIIVMETSIEFLGQEFSQSNHVSPRA